MESTCETKINGIDSCIILRFLLKDNPEQVKLAQDLITNGHDYYVDDVAIMEVVHVMTKEGRYRHEIVDAMLSLLRNVMFVWDRDFFEPVFRDYLEHPSLSFDDIVLAKRAENAGYSCLWTFDRKFAKQAKVAKLLD